MGAVLVSADFVFDFLPNIELVTSLIIAFSVVYRWRVLYSVFVYVLVYGLIHGISYWTIAYFYIFPLFAVITILISKHISTEKGYIIYPILSGAFGISFGTLYAPTQMIAFSLSGKQTLAWIAAGLPWDFTHMCGNIAAGLLIVPITLELRRISKWINY